MGRSYFDKFATSRWREAIRSGEVGQGTADVLRERMKFDPQRHGEGVLRGAENRATRAGYEFGYHRPWEDLKAGVKKIPGAIRGGTTGELLRSAGEKARGTLLGFGGGGGLTHPGLEQIHTVESPHAVMMKGTKGQTLRNLGALTAAHEGTEAQLAKAKGFTGAMGISELAGQGAPDPRYKQVGPGAARTARRYTNVGEVAEAVRAAAGAAPDPTAGRGAIQKYIARGYLPIKGITTSMHMGALPPIQDIREARMFGGGTLERVKGLREMTGEMGTMGRAASNVARRKALLRAGVREPIGRGETALDRIGRIMGQQPDPRLPRRHVGAIAREMENLNRARLEAVSRTEPGSAAKRLSQVIRRRGPAVAGGVRRGVAAIAPKIQRLMRLIGK